MQRLKDTLNNYERIQSILQNLEQKAYQSNMRLTNPICMYEFSEGERVTRTFKAHYVDTLTTASTTAAISIFKSIIVECVSTRDLASNNNNNNNNIIIIIVGQYASFWL